MRSVSRLTIHMIEHDLSHLPIVHQERVHCRNFDHFFGALKRSLTYSNQAVVHIAPERTPATPNPARACDNGAGNV